MSGPFFTAGVRVLRRETLHGLPWMEHPVVVVHDDADWLAVMLEAGSPFTFFGHPFGPHPWSAHKAWTGSSVLHVQREGEAYAAWKFFDLRGRFTHWYVNFQEPFVRHVLPGGGGSFHTADLGLDIVLPRGTRDWHWKDLDDPDAMVTSGRISPVERDRIRAAAGAVATRLDAGERWWSAWDHWRPGDPAPAPEASPG